MIEVQGYHWLAVDTSKDRFLKPLASILGQTFELYCSSSEQKVSRVGADGFWLALGKHKGKHVAVCWCDFRVKGASFSGASGTRITHFLDILESQGYPLIMVLNSLGFRFTEGRNTFSQVFGLVPALDRYRKNNLLVTIFQGHCLGIGAILFGLGHYRLAANKDSTLNLTGPDVFQQFFGKKVDFASIAGAETLHQKTSLIHEVRSSIDDALNHAALLAVALPNESSLPELPQPSINGGTTFLEKNQLKANAATVECLKHFSHRGVELFGGYDDRLKVYVLEFRGRHMAVLINPPDQTNNLFCHRSLELYHHAIKLFAMLKLPLLVMLDTPGTDPRFDGSNQRTIEKLIALTEDILQYPMPTVGIVNGRGYGGANTLIIPKCYGSVAQYGIAGRTHMDVMHESIMRKLLSGSRNLLESWEAMQNKQDADCRDLVDAGVLDDIISYENMADRVWGDLFAASEHRTVSLF